ncbi:hypothetical protein HMPREF3114_18400 [Stenotrophomonas sp. HMSC10F07]|nr:hypothetical protein HMPREF3114_18400 [Stenotrophomonas sp. HMSC10F07]
MLVRECPAPLVPLRFGVELEHPWAPGLGETYQVCQQRGHLACLDRFAQHSHHVHSRRLRGQLSRGKDPSFGDAHQRKPGRIGQTRQELDELDRIHGRDFNVAEHQVG